MKQKAFTKDVQMNLLNTNIHMMFTIEKALEASSLLNDDEQKGVVDPIEFNLRKNKIMNALYQNNQKDS